MNRVAAIQKSSRTITTAWNMLAIALTKSGDQFRVLLTPPGRGAIAQTGPGPAAPFAQDGKMRPLRKFASESTSPNPRDSSGHALRKPLSNRASVSSGVAST